VRVINEPGLARFFFCTRTLLSAHRTKNEKPPRRVHGHRRPGFLTEPQRDGTAQKLFIAVNFLAASWYWSAERIRRRDEEVHFLGDELSFCRRATFPHALLRHVGSDGFTALYFGLSGTGKTTLSADPERRLIGDDDMDEYERHF